MEIQYIKMLAQNTSTDISGWDLNKIFGKIENRCDINKAFFNHAKSLSVKKKVVRVVVPKVTTDAINVAKVVSKLKTVIRRAQKRAQMLEEKMSLVQQDIVETTNKLTQARGGSVESFIEEHIKSILEDGFWENPIFEDKLLYLNTKNDVIMHQSDKSLANKTLNFGKFGVSINLQNLDLRLSVYENNLTDTAGYNGIHPYCFTSRRDMCFGSATMMFGRMKRNLDLPGMMRLLSALLTTYVSDSHPVVRFDHFKQDCKLNYPEYCYDRIEHLHPVPRKKYLNK